MIPSHQLSDTDRHIYEKIFQPNPSDPLVWSEVRSLFRAIADVTWLPNGDYKVVRNGRIVILRPPTNREVSGLDELLELRRFIETSEETPPVVEPPLLEPTMTANHGAVLAHA